MPATHRFAMVCPQRSLSAELLLQELASLHAIDPMLYSPSTLLEHAPCADVLVIMNYSLDNPNTAKLVRLIEHNFHQYKIFLLLEQLGSPASMAAVERLIGVESQQHSAEQLHRAFEAVERGAYWLPRAVTDLLLAERAHVFRPRVNDGLSNKESAVVERLGRGMTNEAIARELGVSANTVKTHLQSVYRKLGVSSRTQVMAKLYA